MPEIWRQKKDSELTPVLLQEKLQRDRAYEIAHSNLTADFNAGKITKARFDADHTKQWKDYEDWAKSSGAYELVSLAQQKLRAEDALTSSISKLNEIKSELGEPLVEVKEKK